LGLAYLQQEAVVHGGKQTLLIDLSSPKITDP
jgi:hypothetical protein